MKLILQIPCLNEEDVLPKVLAELPRRLAGVEAIEVVVIDDGSTDRTAAVAKEHGATVLRHNRHLGLGVAFKTGLEYALRQGADLLVNTDADHQYPARYLPELIRPILEGRADLVIGNRQPGSMKQFSPLKRALQWLGSCVVRRLTATDVPDVVSGFRAYSRAAMYRLNITTRFSYVLDTIMQISKRGLNIVSIPIETNPPTRPSRLFRNIAQHITRSSADILRLYVVYEPFKTFLGLALAFFIPGFLLGLRFVITYLAGSGQGKIQSLIAVAILTLIAVILFALGVLAETVKMNRLLAEEELSNLKQLRYGRADRR